MQKVINIKLAALCALVAAALVTAVPAYAYDELEIELEVKENSILAEIEYQEAGEELEKEYTYDTTSIEEVYDLLAAELGLTKQAIVDAVESVESEESADENQADSDEQEESAEMSDREEAQDKIDDASALVVEAANYIETLEDESEAELLSEYLDTAQAYLADAQSAFDAENYDKAEDTAEMASDKIENLILPDAEGEDGVNKKVKKENKEKSPWTKDKCDNNPGVGVGVEKKCATDYEQPARGDNKYKDYGKSNDRAELQAQMQELMQLLIQLLTMQLANQAS